MVALAPGAEIVPTTYHPKLAENGIFPFENGMSNKKVSLETVEITPPAYDSADPVVITSNGNGTNQLEQNVLNSPIASDTSNSLSGNELMAMEVLKIIESYGVDFEKSGISWKGFESFVPIVLEQISRQEPIRMILPAFPFKSPNASSKVLGTMPDFGEELALAHLNGLCQNIGEVYGPGADVYISSDGLVYNGKKMTAIDVQNFLILTSTRYPGRPR